MFVQRTFTVELDNDPERVPVIVERMLDETGDAIPRD